MGFFNLSRYQQNDYERRKLKDENKRLEQELKDQDWRRRSEKYEQEHQENLSRSQQERDAENERERRMNLLHTTLILQDEIEDLKLKHKFGIEEESK
ncbi:unnamed protein product [marine sediment metagenome]|uniref:Uncharacterized protein n=1 Tax=marine sediment metagenome TaxID=412755 RepID=X1UBX8_9ZZZZ